MLGVDAGGERIQLDGGSRPGPSWSLLLKVPAAGRIDLP